MKMLKHLEYQLRKRVILPFQAKWYSRYQSHLSQELSFTNGRIATKSRNYVHSYMHHYFVHHCPKELREHRRYFSKDQRGFGEDAFHAMWWLLHKDYQPRRCLEIGVYRGQVISLWTLIAKLLRSSIEVHGVSPFLPAGDTVSEYRSDIDYFQDVLESFNTLGLSEPKLLKAFSTDPVALDLIENGKWNLIYIDGGHDYEVVLSDYRAAVKGLVPGGIVVLDDSSLWTDFSPPAFSFAGHEGPSRVVQELARRELIFLGAVGHNNIFQKPDDKADS